VEDAKAYLIVSKLSKESNDKELIGVEAYAKSAEKIEAEVKRIIGT